MKLQKHCSYQLIFVARVKVKVEKFSEFMTLGTDILIDKYTSKKN